MKSDNYNGRVIYVILRNKIVGIDSVLSSCMNIHGKCGYVFNFICLDSATYKNIIEDILEPNECQAGPDVFYLDDKYHMYFVYRYALDFRSNIKRGYRIGYATSNDLFNWSREDKNVGIKYSDKGWDSKMAHYPHIFYPTRLCRACSGA